jgi:putative colanic acid biosysnthesis UDP-glucose lipid carrier transferase
MDEHVIVRNPLAVAFVALLQWIVPSLLAVGALYFLVTFYDVDLQHQSQYHVMAALVAMSWMILSKPRRANGRIHSSSVPLLFGVLLRWMVLLAVLLAVAYATKSSDQFSRRVVLTWAAVTPALLLLLEILFHEVMHRLLSVRSNARSAVFVGCTEASLALAKEFRNSSDLCMPVAGFFDDRSPERLSLPGEFRLLGRLSGLMDYVKNHAVRVIFIALPIRHVQRVINLLDQLRDTTASIYYVPDICLFDLIQTRTVAIQGIPVIAVCETPFYGIRGASKRATDVVVAASVLILLAPLLALLALMIRTTSPGPAIFRQRRYGLDGEQITVYKFRTMTVQEDGAHVRQATANDARTTRVGRFLRRYSLDELPQLINVLRGEMSLVGPRPHAVAHNETYRKLIKGYMIRHKVLPGITGLAQVNGLRGETRSIAQMEARVRYDLEYVRNWSILLDLKILAKTALIVLNDAKAY